MRSKYKFDLLSGHYVLNEDESTNSTANGTSSSTTDNQQDNTLNILPQLNNEEVSQAYQKMQKEMDTFTKDLTQLHDAEVQLKTVISNATDDYNKADADKREALRNSVITNNAKLLQLQLNIAKKEKEQADKKYQYISQILQLQQKANESLIRVLPAKYRNLNESNLHTAKIYMKDLVVNDDEHLLKGMADFKRAFADTNLLYGKDKEGYFVVCVDQEDFNKMYNTLEETGYMRDVIIDNIMPQLFDRKDMIS